MWRLPEHRPRLNAGELDYDGTMDDWKLLEPVLAEAHELLMRKFPAYMGTDPRGHFNVADHKKVIRLSGASLLGSFSAWKDRVSLNLERDPLGTAVHELLHANAFSDDWLPEDTGRKGEIVSYRGFEIQVISAGTRRVKAICHRAINEGVTELLMTHAYPEAAQAYRQLLTFARELTERLGFEAVTRQYFREGYNGLQKLAQANDFDLDGLIHQADAALGDDDS